MKNETDRDVFASDNTANACPAVWQALLEANHDSAPSYGEDRWTQRACDLVREIFEIDCEVFFTFNGTAANALALAQLTQPFSAILCHERAHIHTDECSAPEFFSGGAKLVPTRGHHGKLELAEIEAALRRHPDLHSAKPRVLTLTQATEFGTVYTRDEIGALTDFARAHALAVHMDGARFANAVATLGHAPRELTWEAGVEVLCFGGIKNGGAVGELVVFFKKELARDFEYRAKQAGQLASKMRFLAASWIGLLEDDLWLKNARAANAGAQALAEKLRTLPGITLAFPREANAVFVHLNDSLGQKLRARGWHFYKFVEPDVHRLMCPWSITERAIDDFVADVRELSS